MSLPDRPFCASPHISTSSLAESEKANAQNWISELCWADLFEVINYPESIVNADQPTIQDLGVPLHLGNDMTSKVNMLLAFAYDTRDIHIGELFILQRLHRRTTHALELQRAALGDMRERVSMDCSELDEVKETLKKRGFMDTVNDFANARECPAGNIPPADIAFVYKYDGTRLCTHIQES